MRRRLEQLLNGRFEYEVPHLLLSETEVALTLDEEIGRASCRERV